MASDYKVIIKHGAQGPQGQGVPSGGTAGQFLQKVDGADYNTHWVDSTASVAALGDVGDVTLTALASGEILKWNGAAWVNAPDANNGVWGSITGTLSSQTDLQAALDGKSDTTHNHDSDYATAAQGALADSATQPGDNISTLTNDAGFITDYTVTEGDVTAHQAALSITSSQISDLASYTGLDVRYYTETEVDSLLTGKANTSHTHVMADITDSMWISDITAESLTDLSDIPTIVGQAGKLLKVNPTEDGFIWGDPAGTSVSWGDITGTLSTQTDLQSALDGKAASSHTHVMADITDSTWISDITAESIGDLSDVTNVTPADKHVLIFDGVTDNKYENRQLVKADLSDFSDGDYATVAQGVLADTATQPGDNVSTLTNDAGYLTSFTESDPVFLAQKGAANGVATLGADSKVPQAQLPAIAITDTDVVASEVAMLALTAQTGDVAVRTDLNKTFILAGTDPSVLGDWQEMLTPTDSVQSVDGRTGVVTLGDLYAGISHNHDSDYAPKMDGEPNGFVDRTDVTYGWNDATRTLTLTGTYDIYSDGNKFTKTGASFQISDVEGPHFIYYDETGTLVETLTFDISIINRYCYVASLYWDSTNNVVVPSVLQESHGAEMSAETHSYLHTTIGCAYVSGMALSLVSEGDGNSDSHAQFTSSAGTVRDEDILHEIVARTSLTDNIRVLYRDGVSGNWRMGAASPFPVLTTGTGRVAFNEYTGGAWQLTEVGNNDFVLAHIYAVPGLNTSSGTLVAIMGTEQYSTLGQAQEGANTEALQAYTNLPVEEYKLIATIIFQTSDGYNNTVKARIRETSQGADYVDWRQSTPTAGAGTSTVDWGEIAGTLSNQADLQSVLDGKSDTSHSHNVTDLTDTLIDSPADDEVLAYDTGSASWKNQTAAEASLATAAQGALADTATQPGDNVSTLTNDAGYITGVAWGDVTGTLSAQTDLQSALDAKATAPSTATVQTTDATPTTLATIVIPTDEEKMISIKCHGHEDATDDHIWKKMVIGVKNVAGTATIVGGVDSSIGYDAGAAAWTITATVSLGNVVITVTGEAAKTIDWRSTTEID